MKSLQVYQDALVECNQMRYLFKNFFLAATTFSNLELQCLNVIGEGAFIPLFKNIINSRYEVQIFLFPIEKQAGLNQNRGGVINKFKVTITHSSD